MRISTSTIYDLNIGSMDQLQSNLLNTQLHISSGKRVMTPADDPVAAAQAVSVNQAIATNTQQSTTNNNAAQAALGLEDNALQSVTTLLQSVQSIAVQAGNGAFTNADRQSLATALQGNLSQLIGLANSTDGAGNYLFSGGMGTVQSFTQTAAGASYNGNDSQNLMQVAPARQIPVNDSGANIFMRIRNGNGAFATGAASMTAGANVMPGATGIAYDFSAATQVDGLSTEAVTATGSGLNFSGAGAAVQFDVAGTAGTTTVSLNADYSATGLAQMVADINTQLGAGTSGVTASLSGTTIRFTQAGSTAAPVISNTNANAQTAGFANSNGFAGGANQNAIFSVDGTPVTVNQAVANQTDLAAAVQAGLTAAGLTAYTASVSGAGIQITHTGSTIPVAISGANASAVNNGILNSAGTAGSASGPSTNSGSGVISQGSLANPPPTALQSGNSYQIAFTVTGGVTTYSITGIDANGASLPTAAQPGVLPANVAYASGQNISFNGIQFNIQGSPANGDTFTVVPSSNVSIFQTITGLINTLNAGVAPGDPVSAASYSQQLSTAMSDLSQGLNNVLTVRASVGARLNELSVLQTSGTALSTVYQQNLSQLQDLDITKAASQLTQQQTTLTAALQSFQKISTLSLFNYM